MLQRFFRKTAKVNVAVIVALAFLTACNLGTTNAVEAGIDTTALAALTSGKVVLQHPCTATVTTMCADKDLIEDVKAVRLLVMGALRTYWTSADAYKKAVKDGGDEATTEAAKDAAYAALEKTVAEATALYGVPEVMAILSLSNSVED